MRALESMEVKRYFTVSDLEDLSLGTGVYGSGGGGQPKIGRLRLQSLLTDDQYPDRVPIVSVDSLADDLVITSVGQIGSPTIGSEKLPRKKEEYHALKELENFSSSSVDALIPGEIGGENSFVPLIVSVLCGLPVIDADAMGRALPEVQMDTFFIYGQDANFTVFSNEKGKFYKYKDVESAKKLEDLARSAAVESGGTVASAYPILKGKFVKKYSVHGTLSDCYDLGAKVHNAQQQKRDPVESICEATDGKLIAAGKVVEVKRSHQSGFTTGTAQIQDLKTDSKLRLEFQNEFIKCTKGDEILVTVPDVISVVDSEVGEPITSDRIQYGQRVSIIGIPAPDLLTTNKALKIVGPDSFGLDCSYTSVN